MRLSGELSKLIHRRAAEVAEATQRKLKLGCTCRSFLPLLPKFEGSGARAVLGFR